MMTNTRQMKPEEVQQVGATLGYDWDRFNSQQFRRVPEGALGYTMDPGADLTADAYWASRLAFLETPLRRSILILNFIKG